MKHVAVVGGSLAGLSAARALRAQGYDGVLTVVGAEPHRPYDRPPLSKQLLAGTMTPDDLRLEADDEDLGADWRLGVRALDLDPATRTLSLSDGSELSVDAVVAATGATPRRLAGPAMSGVHVLRTLEDSLALRAELLPGVRLVVVGAGFVGAEVASTASGLGVEVTVVGAAPTPLVGPLGARMGGAVAELHARHGVDLQCGTPAVGLVAGAVDHPGSRRVTGVALADGRVLPADVVVVGIGVTPQVDWLRRTGIPLHPGVCCDAAGATSLQGVVAVGDCSAWFDPLTGEHRRVEHWSAAVERAGTAVATLLGTAPARSLPPKAPYFWSDQYGARIQFAGQIDLTDSIDLEIGTEHDDSFLAVYRRDGRPVAVLGVNQAREFGRWRRQLSRDGAL